MFQVIAVSDWKKKNIRICVTWPIILEIFQRQCSLEKILFSSQTKNLHFRKRPATPRNILFHFQVKRMWKKKQKKNPRRRRWRARVVRISFSVDDDILTLKKKEKGIARSIQQGNIRDCSHLVNGQSVGVRWASRILPFVLPLNLFSLYPLSFTANLLIFLISPFSFNTSIVFIHFTNPTLPSFFFCLNE